MDQNKKNLIEPISAADSKRYHEKLTVGGVRLPDPFYQVDADAWCSDLSELPFVTFPDMYVYFVLRKGLYTCQEMKAYRSLEAFLYFESGHVQEVLTKKVDVGQKKVVFLRSKVLPSQRVGVKTKPYEAWVLCEESGEVISGHCTCMAG